MALTELKDKNVIVVGLARSGRGAANLLSELGAKVTVTDIKDKDELEEFIEGLNPSVKLVLGSHPEDLFTSADMMVISPGVSLYIQPISLARENGIPVISELELAYQVITKNLKINFNKPATPPSFESPLNSLKNEEQGGIILCKKGFLALTGTNGKSTTTALLDFIMKKGGFKTILGGNIGNAISEEIFKIVKNLQEAGNEKGSSFDFIVAEVSSFQLETIRNLRPKVAGIVNITPDHLDRYYSLKEYAEAKARIFENQKENDFLVLNRDDPETIKVAGEKLKVKSAKPRVVYFSRKQEVEGVYYKDGQIFCNLPDLSSVIRQSLLINADEIRIKGVHNIENAMAASAMALLAGCSLEAVIDSLREFPGLEHRLEFVREIEGVRYFNDSKGTNIGAVVKSLESFARPVILIAGGRDKAGDFSLLRPLVREKVKAAVLIGEDGEKIKKALEGVTETFIAEDLKDAVYAARNMAARGDVVLLSPGCASFDMFLNFEDRGRQFKSIVTEM
ncbi:MAG: UDP-N-acetylmuramoyl-L-alanine--D-glutamate ligase [Nitrospirae bacterium]|nr:UDP-N-acetylmuramoyl-L-alanine--D-glutamate ligase [Nitrospirota bacterium]